VLVKLRVGRRDVVAFCDLLHGIDPYRALILPARRSLLKFACLVFASRVTEKSFIIEVRTWANMG
jgi:hypothetical protein